MYRHVHICTPLFSPIAICVLFSSGHLGLSLRGLCVAPNRFASDNKSGDNTSLGWNDFMRMSEFSDPEAGFLQDDTAIFSAGFHIIKETASFSRIQPVSIPRKARPATLTSCCPHPPCVEMLSNYLTLHSWGAALRQRYGSVTNQKEDCVSR
eukprot:scaffold97931_cov41-Prasinocladus_malaysianus.AAC.1